MNKRLVFGRLMYMGPPAILIAFAIAVNIKLFGWPDGLWMMGGGLLAALFFLGLPWIGIDLLTKEDMKKKYGE